MKKVGFVIGLVVVLAGVVLFYPKSDNQKILVEDNQLNQNTSLSFYIEGEDGSYSKTNTLPSTGYTLNTSKSICSNGAIPTWENNRLYFNNLTKNGTSCYLYFDIKPLAMNSILANKEIKTRDDFSTTITETTTGVIYKSLDESQYDNDGEVYYFAGNPQDNWVKFGGYYWRIIRINGNGSIRVIYQGTNADSAGTGTQIQTSAFNPSNNNNMYVGYMYTSGNAHGLGTNSTVKEVLDKWYQNNLASYTDKIDEDAGFCGDRAPFSGSGIGTTYTEYGAFNRLDTNKNPSFECTNDSDLFTISGSGQGNKSLTYPIGLITADEVVFAGGVNEVSNSGYYLYTGQDYWTMSPSFYNSYGYMFVVDFDGLLNNLRYVNYTFGVRPVINLRADVTLTGSGTSTDPYVVEGAE